MDGFYTNFFNLINDTLSTFITNTVSSTISAINPTVNVMLLLAVVWFGWVVLLGSQEMPIKQLFMKLLMWISIVSIATKTGLHSQFIVDFFWKSPDALASAIISTGGSGSGSISSIGFIDELFVKFDNIANGFNQQSISFSDFGASIGNTIFAWVIWIMGGLLTMTAAFYFIMAKTALAVLLGISPIFIIMLIFSTTRKFFDAWLGQVLNYVFLPMLTAAFISVVLTALNQLMPPAGGVTQEKAIQLIALTGVSWFLLLQVPSMASVLGGGVAISTLGFEQKAAGFALKTGWGGVKMGGRATLGVGKFAYNSPVGKPLKTAVGYTADRYNHLIGKYSSISKIK
ncbi:Type IV secretion system protein VirB6 [uncultured bacterium]|nr:Type IV secretion system protein VirB6 [uncultured bacterium]